MQSYSFLFLIERENGFATGVGCLPVTVSIGEGLVVKLIKRAAAVIAALAVLAGGVAAPSLASPDTSDGGETRATERAAGIPVGPNLTATWDSTTKTLTVAGHGELDRKQWMDLKKQHCATQGKAEPRKILFAPKEGSDIIFPADSSILFQGCFNAEIYFPPYGINTSGVTNMRGMFAQTHRANPEVSNWDVSNCTNFTQMFWEAGANPDVSRWKPNTKANFRWMFRDAENITIIDISNWTFDEAGTYQNSKKAEFAFWTRGRTVFRLKGKQFAQLQSQTRGIGFQDIRYEVVEEANPSGEENIILTGIQGRDLNYLFSIRSDFSKYQDDAIYLIRRVCQVVCV
ncbi:BspA family leucine-rich repeat surface protein [Actinotignum sp. GS-2025b]|uniref:BspA family leucine-rich repeat surface protein n=1 Tax=Actinotignum sp. GS-2025b TaxID=3427275 RepID=UPI003F457E02